MTRQFGGLGLGLAISMAITKLYRGTLTARSKGKVKGSTFALRLPLLPAQAAVPAPPKTTHAPAPARAGLRILLVEDHEDTARVMRRLLSSQGYKVQHAVDVTTALKLADENTFDLLLSDLGLPDGSGLDLMRALRERGMKLPGIALSGYGQEQDMQQSSEAGFAAHLVKPVNLTRLKETIVKLVGDGKGSGEG